MLCLWCVEFVLYFDSIFVMFINSYIEIFFYIWLGSLLEVFKIIVGFLKWFGYLKFLNLLYIFIYKNKGFNFFCFVYYKFINFYFFLILKFF